MAQETIFINFEVDYTELSNAQAELAKTGKVDTKGFQAIQTAISETATDTKGLIKQFKDVGGAAIKMGKSVEDAFGAGIQDALDEAGVSVDEFSAALKKTSAPAVSLKKELKELKEALARMKAEGKDTGKEFESLRARAGKLSDAIADANAEIKNAGSDTRNIDNVVGSISALAGGYAAVQGAAALFGDESEDLQKTLVKVNAAMAIAQGIQQVSNALQKEGALLKLKDSIATTAQTAAQTVYAAAVGTSTGAMKAFRIALLATGIGAIIVLLGLAAQALGLFGDKSDDAKKAQDDLKASIELVNTSLEVQAGILSRRTNEQLAKMAAEGKSQNEINKARLKAQLQELKLLEQKETNLRKLASLEKTGSEEQQALYKEANDVFYEQENLKSKILIQNYEQEQKRREEAKKKQEEFDKKRKEELERALKDAEAQQRTADANAIKAALDRVNKEIEAERIKYDNFEDMRAEDAARKKKDAADWDAQWKAFQESLVKTSEDATEKLKQQAAEQKRLDDERIQRMQTYLEVGVRVAGIFAEIGRQQSERDQQAIASQRTLIDEQLKAGAITQKQAEARFKQLDKLSRKAQQDAAKREKQAAVFTAALAIPKAFLQGLTQGGIKLAVVYAALAAVEAALIASRPIPKFFRGKKDRYEGPGVVGDMGAELVERGGRMFLYTKPTETYLGANDKVYTAAETRNIMHNTNINTTVRPQPVKEFDYDRLGKAIPRDSISINIDKDFISESVANGMRRNNYMDRRYSSRR